MGARAVLGWRLTCAGQGASLTLAAPSFAHPAAAADLLGDALGQRQGAGARPHRPVAQPLLHGDGLVGCNRHSRGVGRGPASGKRREERGSGWERLLAVPTRLAWPESQSAALGRGNAQKNVGRNGHR